MQTILLPRGNPAAVRIAGQGEPNRACATRWPSGDNRNRQSSRVNGWLLRRKSDSSTTREAPRGESSARELRRIWFFFGFRKKFAK
jgi:hypothetical protein